MTRTRKGQEDDMSAAFDFSRMDEDLDPLDPKELQRRRKRRRGLTPDAQAVDLVTQLQDVIEQAKDSNKKGMKLREWQNLAESEIAACIRENRAEIMFKESMNAKRISDMLMRSAFMVLAAAMAFSAFWLGMVYVGREFGLTWGLLAATTAVILTGGFVALGLKFGEEDEGHKAVMKRHLS